MEAELISAILEKPANQLFFNTDAKAKIDLKSKCFISAIFNRLYDPAEQCNIIYWVIVSFHCLFKIIDF